jgi:hypothetical protein
MHLLDNVLPQQSVPHRCVPNLDRIPVVNNHNSYTETLVSPVALRPAGHPGEPKLCSTNPSHGPHQACPSSALYCPETTSTPLPYGMDRAGKHRPRKSSSRNKRSGTHRSGDGLTLHHAELSRVGTKIRIRDVMKLYLPVIAAMLQSQQRMNSAGIDIARREGVKCQGFINDLKKERVSLYAFRCFKGAQV